MTAFQNKLAAYLPGAHEIAKAKSFVDIDEETVKVLDLASKDEAVAAWLESHHSSASPLDGGMTLAQSHERLRATLLQETHGEAKRAIQAAGLDWSKVIAILPHVIDLILMLAIRGDRFEATAREAAEAKDEKKPAPKK